LEEISAKGMENILALRGDKPKEIKCHDCQHASQLIEIIKRKYPHFCIGIAGYPEKHPESPSKESDLMYLKKKIDSGAEYIITQMFFDNAFFFEFMNETIKMKIDVPILPGIMPIFSYKNISKFANRCGVEIPIKLRKVMEKYKDDDESMMKFGIDYAVKQCNELMENDVVGLHFYTMNRAIQVREIIKQLLNAT